ncbi:hypothetical protein [Parabacteroides sp.]
MDDKQPYIKQRAEDEELYSRLQKQTLEEVQRLSGKVWTDYNTHDPGVTLADIANYMLTELNYKLGFDQEDYLTDKSHAFEPERFGFFPPDEVYTTAPVTTEDYRRLFFSYIPDLENVWMECDTATGGYTVKVLLSPFKEERKDVMAQVEAIYNKHRNLCEYLEKVEIVQHEELEFCAEFEIEAGKDASFILATVYWTILSYLFGEVSISLPEYQPGSGLSLEQWLEGSENALRVVIPELQNTEYELYKKLCAVNGIRSFSICYLKKETSEKKKVPLTDFSQGYSLKIPRKEEDLQVVIRCGRSQVKVDMQKFMKKLKAFYFMKGRTRISQTEKKSYDWGTPVGTYRDIFTHYQMAGEFPACYGLVPDRKPPTSFGAYLKLYDRTIEEGLQEVKELPRLLSLREEDVIYASARDVFTLKSRYLDFIDRLYGVESQPKWLEESDCYGETDDEILSRRMAFLRHLAYLIKNRAKARDISIRKGEGNAPVVKEWFCRLLGIDGNEDHIVSNVLPGHNLQLVEKDGDKTFFDRLDALLIDERLLEWDNMLPVTYEQLATDIDGKHKEYEQLRAELPIFNENRISGDLFRNGTNLDNYRIVKAGIHEFMLVFHNREREGWLNLGRLTDKARLNTLANILRRYFRELNLECETLYVVEPVLVRREEPFRLLLVLPSWTLRFHTPRFRDMCRDLLRSIVPAHLTGQIYWLDETSMQNFENYYRQLMIALSDSDLKEYCKRLLYAIYKILKSVQDKEEQDKEENVQELDGNY